MESVPLLNICDSQPATVEKEPETVGFGQDGNLKPAVPHFKLASFSDMYKIGEGGEGTVYRANSGQFGEVALKCLRQKTFVKGNSREIEVLVKIRHPHIVQIFGIIQNGYDVTRPSGFVMEYMKMGSLHKGEYFNSNMESSASTLIHDPQIAYGMGQIYSWISQASLGLQYLHQHNIIHRDIKPQNMLLKHSLDDLKLADFGLARETAVRSITGGVGTVFYMAPEVIQAATYAAPADVYSLTITLWEMIHRRRPFDEEECTSEFKIAAEVKDGRRPILDVLKVDPEMEKLLQRGWHQDSSQRISVSEITVTIKLKLEKNLSAGQTVIEASDSYSVDQTEQSALTSLEDPYAILDEKKTPRNSLKLVGSLLILSLLSMGVLMAFFYMQNDKKDLTWQDNSNDKQRRNDLNVITAPTPSEVPSSRPRVQSNETILLIGGEKNTKTGALDNLILFDRNASQWKTSALKLLNDSRGAGLAYLNKEIYVFGGIGLRKETYKFDNSQLKWVKLADMNEIRTNVGRILVVFENCIWAIGGGVKNAKSVEKYCPQEEETQEETKWIQMPELKKGRRSAAATVCNGKIIISGGKDEDKNTFLRSVESYDHITGNWSDLPELPDPRAVHTMNSIGSSLVVVGGYSGNFTDSNAVWKLNLVEKNSTWEKLQNLQQKRSEHLAATMKDEIWVIGGGEDPKKVEVFNGTTWQDGPKLPNPFLFVQSAAVIPIQLADALLQYE